MPQLMAGKAAIAAVPNGTYRMNNEFRRQPVAARELRVAGGAPSERLAFAQQLGPRRAMNRPVDAPAAEQRAIRRVDDGIDGEGRDIGLACLQTASAQHGHGNLSLPAARLPCRPLGAERFGARVAA